MLNKKEPFNEHLGQLVDSVKFVQSNNAYSPSGEYLGRFKDGKLEKKLAKPEKDSDISLDGMDRGQLVAYAMDTFGKTLKGNAVTIKKQILTLANEA